MEEEVEEEEGVWLRRISYAVPALYPSFWALSKTLFH